MRAPALVFWIVALLALAPPAGRTQTIHLNDRNRLYGAFRATGNPMHLVPDLSQLVEWHLDTTKDLIQKCNASFGAKKLDTTLLWVALWDDQNSRCHTDPNFGKPSGYLSRRLRLGFYLMWNGQGFPVILSAWESTPHDSLRFLGAFPTGYDPFNDSVWVNHVAELPDSSVLLHLRSSRSSDVDNGSDWFYRWQRQCAPCLLLESHWAREAGRRVLYSTDYLDQSSRVNQITEFCHCASGCRGGPLEPFALDSAHAEVIDLWELAKEKCHLDTSRGY
jgi:hypothetical protein